MKYPIVRFRKRASLSGMITNGTAILANDPRFLDHTTVPGHFSDGFTGRRIGPWVESTNSSLQKYFDATNYWMTLPLDMHAHFDKNKQLLEEIGMAMLNAGTVSEFGSVLLAEFVSRIATIWPKMHRVLTYNAGTQATDAALKWANSLVMIRNGLKPEQMQIVAVESAFHGRCGYGIEATRTSPKTADYQTGVVLRIPDPVVVFDSVGRVLKEATSVNLKQSLAALEIHFKQPTTSAVIIEFPMLAEGGALVVIPEFLNGARALCDQYGKFLVIDCVQMFGKNGSWLPKKVMELADAVTIGKYSRVCAALLSDPSRRGYPDYAGIPGKFGATWLGHEAAILATLAVMKVIEDESLFKNAVQMAKKMYKELVVMAKAGSGVVCPRIVGSYLGFDIEIGRDKLVKRLEAEGVLILPAGDRSIRFAPRLDTEDWEIDYLLEKMTTALTHMKDA